MSNASNTACTCPACNGSTEADHSAFICLMQEAAVAARTKKYFRTVHIKAERHALHEARAHRAAAASGRWDSATTEFYARAAVMFLDSAKAKRAARLAA